ncbi:putative flagellar protein FlaG [Thiobacillus denitrificans ATCC 25259]|uniref:Putative flagellar protein FlaG n=1 Tax=Thiobacillus denitrificans (strain ATCC 25259 / T1) TaxID=292415 RepID=Q3SII4_THIDA|nr:flagellar protein FlaG [Thiobacillus denitrificans]AAZ97544.1 putative flagellar protein FlaG [Thiobacillus denitrificans ATCC 25259]
MLIQNVNNTNQALQPARLAGDGGPVSVVSASNVQAPPTAVPNLQRTAADPAAEAQPSAMQLKNVVEAINKTLQQANKNLEFIVDSETHDPVVKLVDSETGDVIRQFPTEEALSIARAIDSFQQGLLIKQKA